MQGAGRAEVTFAEVAPNSHFRGELKTYNLQNNVLVRKCVPLLKKIKMITHNNVCITFNFLFLNDHLENTKTTKKYQKGFAMCQNENEETRERECIPVGHASKTSDLPCAGLSVIVCQVPGPSPLYSSPVPD